MFRRETLALGCFVASGAAGLVFELCWMREATRVFGSATAGVSAVLAIFFAGLALGNAWFGRLAHRWSRPLVGYAVLELVLAGLALASGLAFAAAGAAYASVADAGLGSWLRLALLALLLLPPTVAMGGTLPLFSQHLLRASAGRGARFALLYAANTAGAVAGCVATGFWLLPAVGVQGALQVGAGCSVVAAGGALLLARREPRLEVGGVEEAPQSSGALLPLLFFGTGVVALGSQVAWARHLGLLVRNTAYTYTATLAAVLVGIVAGAAISAACSDRLRDRGLWFGALQVAVGLLLLALPHLPPQTWAGFDNDLLVCAVLLLPTSVLAGITFPLGIRIALATSTATGRTVGRMAAYNTFGGIAGALLVGYVCLPRFGASATFALLSAVSIALGVVALLGLGQRPRIGWAVAVAAVLAWWGVPAALGTRLPADYLAPKGQLVAIKEGWTANLAAVHREGSLRLEIDRWWQGSDIINHQVVAAHLPMLCHPDPKRVLVVGIGPGQAPRRFLHYDIEQLDCVDIEPALFDFAAEHFGGAWMEDPRVRLVREDGRHFVAYRDNVYDVVSLEIGQLFRPGAAAFYTLEFYRELRSRLRPGGLVAQFVPLAFLGSDGTARVVRTFLDAYPAAALYYNTQELLLVGGVGEVPVPADERLALLEKNAAIQRDLAYSPWGGLEVSLARSEVLAASYLCGPAELQALTAGSVSLSEDLPWLEYHAAAVGDNERRDVDALRELRANLAELAPVFGGALAVDELSRAEVLRQSNLANIEAAAELREARRLRYAGDVDAARGRIAAARACNPQSLPARLEAAQLDLQTGNLDDAEKHLREVLAAWPGHPLALTRLGLVLLRAGRDGEAAPVLQRALQLRPKDPDAHNYLGAVLARAGQLAEAREHVQRSLALRPDHPLALVHLRQIDDALGR